MLILAGATGNTGSLTAAELQRRGVPFKALVRSEAAERKLAALGYATVRGDLDDRAGLDRALGGGFTRAFIACTPDERMLARESAFIDAARAAGVRHLVKISAFLAARDAESKNLRDHGVIEEHLMASGMDWTILRPHGFMQTFVLFSIDFVKDAGLYMHPAGDGSLPLVDVRDVARAAVKALTEEGLAGRAYDLTGPEDLSFKEQARQLGRALGRPVTYVPSSEADVMRVMKMMKVAPQSMEHVKVVMRMTRERRMGAPTDDLGRLGIAPTTFARFAEDLAAGRTGGGNSFAPPSGLLLSLMATAVKWSYRARFALLGRPE